jgi:hypothetical protein
MKSSSKKMETVSQYINWARTEGYDIDFQVCNKKICSVDDQKKTYSAKDAKIVGFSRFEGDSDPGDSSIVYMIETSDGKKGTLVDAYGMYSDADVSSFLKSIYQDIRYNPEAQSGTA